MPGRQKKAERRLTGLGGTVLGMGGNAQWEIVETDAKVAQDVITFLEDRRVLYLPINVEVVECSMASVQELRKFLTDALQRTSPDSPLARNLSTHPRGLPRFHDPNRCSWTSSR